MHREVVAPVVEACVGNLLAGRILDGDAVGVRPAGLQEQAGEEVLAAPGLRSTRWERTFPKLKKLEPHIERSLQKAP